MDGAVRAPNLLSPVASTFASQANGQRRENNVSAHRIFNRLLTRRSAQLNGPMFAVEKSIKAAIVAFHLGPVRRFSGVNLRVVAFSCSLVCWPR